MKQIGFLRSLLLVGAIYLFLIAGAHFFQIKMPILFIYFDVASNVYQDRIISAVSFAVAIFLFGCFKEHENAFCMVRYAIWAGWAIVSVLVANNVFADSLLRVNPIYWAEISFVAIYVLLLTFASRKK